MRLSPDAPWIEIARPVVRIAGNVAQRIVVTAPSRVSAGAPFDIHLRVEDQWGNPSTLDQAIRIESPTFISTRATFENNSS